MLVFLYWWILSNCPRMSKSLTRFLKNFDQSNRSKINHNFLSANKIWVHSENLETSFFASFLQVFRSKFFWQKWSCKFGFLKNVCQHLIMMIFLSLLTRTCLTIFFSCGADKSGSFTANCRMIKATGKTKLFAALTLKLRLETAYNS